MVFTFASAIEDGDEADTADDDDTDTVRSRPD